MNAEQAKALREPFPPAVIGKLPKPTRKDNPKGNCAECGGWHGLPAVHLDYASHAAVTDRLLTVDPDWTWEPMARGPNGEPLVTDGGLWIWLTVCGVTRPGFGDAAGGKGPKEMIGDALRNAAMRFGVGLDLWAKEDLHAVQDSRDAQEEQARLDALTEQLVAAVGKPEDEPELRAKVASHRAKGTVESHAAWLTKCIEAAEAKSSGAREAPPDSGEHGTESVEAATVSVPQPDWNPEASTPAAGPEGDGASSGPSPFAPPASVGANKACATFKAGTTETKTLNKLNMEVVEGRKAGWVTTEDVYGWARELAPDLVKEDAFYIAEDGVLHWSDLRAIVPLWLASQLIDRLKDAREFAQTGGRLAS